MLYKVGETVVCKGSGVCKITDIRRERFGDSAQKYYILTPVYETCPTKLFIPVANEKNRIRALICADDIAEYISSAASDFNSLWIDDEKEREKAFDEIIKSEDYAKIIKIVGEIHSYQNEKRKKNGKLRQSDERIMKEAEKTINNEFAFVLDISPEEVKGYILSKLRENMAG
ncbi:MAG: CarD family transcriptional regulator [Acutalibacteraceae bacterium]